MLGSMKKPNQEWVKGNSEGELNESIGLYSNLFKQSMNLKGILKGILGREIFLENTLAEWKHRDQASWKYVHKHRHMYYHTYITSNEHKFLKVNAFIF